MPCGVERSMKIDKLSRQSMGVVSNEYDRAAGGGYADGKSGWYARVAELVDALDLGSSSGDRVGVQISPLAPEQNRFKRPGHLFWALGI